MVFASIVVFLGLAMLVWGSERFVVGASATARNLGISPLLIGLTIVGVGTSAPEVFVSAMASLNGNPGVSIGNAIGSNIANHRIGHRCDRHDRAFDRAVTHLEA